MAIENDADFEKWGIPTKATPQQRVIWSKMVDIWKGFAGDIPELSLDIGSAIKKGRTVSMDPFPRGMVDVRAIGENLPFLDQKFTSVVLESVLKHVFSPKQTLDEANRVLKKGGYLFLTSPVNNTDSHNHSFSASQLCHIIEDSGFRIIRKMGLGLSFVLADRIIQRRALRLYSLLRFPVRFSGMLFVVAEKN